ncbi:MAG: TetR family transcriptional regulator, partial [Sphingobium sp.]|nr:TetR family transcriptional regulator [Sphingobium sp.]
MADTEKIRKRGRPRAFDRDRALDQAQALFHVHGYEGVGVAALAS